MATSSWESAKRERGTDRRARVQFPVLHASHNEHGEGGVTVNDSERYGAGLAVFDALQRP